jgi:hypothetical protein
MNSGAGADTRYFACVWGKKSNRKHKKWEGDAYLKGTNTIMNLATFELLQFCIQIHFYSTGYRGIRS